MASELKLASSIRSEERTLWIDFWIAESEDHKAFPHRWVSEISGERNHILITGSNPLDLLFHLICRFRVVAKSIAFFSP